jgi:hypothetical protein
MDILVSEGVTWEWLIRRIRVWGSLALIARQARLADRMPW